MKKQDQKNFRDMLTPEGRENFDKILGYATALLLISQNEEVQQIAAAYRAVLGGALKGLLLEASDFFTELDIAAVKKMEAAGIRQENAVALQRSSIIYALLPALGKNVSAYSQAFSKASKPNQE